MASYYGFSGGKPGLSVKLELPGFGRNTADIGDGSRIYDSVPYGQFGRLRLDGVFPFRQGEVLSDYNLLTIFSKDKRLLDGLSAKVLTGGTMALLIRTEDDKEYTARLAYVKDLLDSDDDYVNPSYGEMPALVAMDASDGTSLLNCYIPFSGRVWVSLYYLDANAFSATASVRKRRMLQLSNELECCVRPSEPALQVKDNYNVWLTSQGYSDTVAAWPEVD